MKTISLVTDKIDGSPFAVLLIDKDQVTAYGSPGQGEEWADWVNSQDTTINDINDVLDIRLVAGKPVSGKLINESDIAKYIDQESMDSIMQQLNQKVLLQIIETKTVEQNDDDFAEDDLPDYVPISVWPLSDISIASIDVAYKSLLTEYKAKAFNLDRERRALELEVKWARAVWDNDAQGWRCPVDTPNGGQFTNRLGLGCTVGVVRRLGQALMSIEDRKKIQMQLPGMEDPRGFLYRSGELIDQRAATRIRKFAERKERRAARRVRSLIAKQGLEEQKKLEREQKRSARAEDSFRTLYSTFNPEASPFARARAAGAIKLRRFASRIEQESIQNLSDSRKRRDRRVRAVSEETLDSKKLRKLRDFGGRIPGSKLGGYVILDKADESEMSEAVDYNGTMSVPRVLTDMDEMHSNPFYGREMLTDDDGNNIPNPHANHKWVTIEEILAMTSLNRATKPMHDWPEMRRGRGFPGSDDIRYVDAKELKRIAKQHGYHGVRSPLRDDGGDKTVIDRGRGNGKTKPAQSGPIGELFWEPDDLPPSVRKRVANAWKESRDRLSTWIANLDPLAEGKTRRQQRRDKRGARKQSAAGTTVDGLLQRIVNARRPGANIDDPNRALDELLLLSAGQERLPDTFNDVGNIDLINLETMMAIGDVDKDGRSYAEQMRINHIIGTPTPEFETIKNVLDAIISEYDAGVMALSNSESEPALPDVFSTPGFKGRAGEDLILFTKVGYGGFSNIRLVTHTDGTEEMPYLLYEFIGIEPWRSYKSKLDPTEKFQYNNAGIGNIFISSQRLTAPENIIQRAMSGDLTIGELARLATEGYDPDAETLRMWDFGLLRPAVPGDERRLASMGRLLNGDRTVSFDINGRPLVITAEHRVPFIPALERRTTAVGEPSLYIPGSGNVKVDTRTAGLISGRMSSAQILTPEGDNSYSNLNRINPFTGRKYTETELTAYDLAQRGPFDVRGSAIRRLRRGETPRRPGIIERYLDPENRQLARERRNARRVMKGRTPRDTRPIRQRIEAALYERGRRATGEPRPEWVQSPATMRELAQEQDGIDIPLLPQLEAWMNGPGDLPNNAQWGEQGVNAERVRELNKSLNQMGGSFFPLVSDLDIERAPEISEMIREWLNDINNPAIEPIPGETSNWGFADWRTVDGYTYVFDVRSDTRPPIAVIHNDSGTTHLIGKDGKHLASFVSRLSPSGEEIFLPVASPETHNKITKRGETPGFIERVIGKFRRRNNVGVSEEQIIPGLRARTRALTRGDSSNTITRVKKTAFGGGDIDISALEEASMLFPYSFPSKQYTGTTYDETLGALSSGAEPDLRQQRGMSAVETMSSQVAATIRKQMKLRDSDELIDSDVKDYIDDLEKAGKKREAGILRTNIHDLAVLDDILESGDLKLIDNLKPGRRHAVIEAALGVAMTDSSKKRRRKMDADLIRIPEGIDVMDRIRARQAREKSRTLPPGKVDIYVPSPEAGTQLPPPKPATGPALIPGQGDITGQIIHQNGLYLDTTTGTYVEDLSGLDVESADFVHVPAQIPETSLVSNEELTGFPELELTVTGPGTPGTTLVAVAPGISSDNPDVMPTGRPDSVRRRVGNVGSFTQAFYLLRSKLYRESVGSPERPGRSGAAVDRILRGPQAMARAFDSWANPLLAKADNLESIDGISVDIAPSSPEPGPTRARALLRAIRNASRRSSGENGLFADYMPEADGDFLMYEPVIDADNQYGKFNISDVHVMDALGLFSNLPFNTVYLPATRQITTDGSLGREYLPETAAAELYRSINTALQLDYAVSRLRAILSDPTRDVREWNDMYGTSATPAHRAAPGIYDATQASLDELERLSGLAWIKAARDLSDIANKAARRRNEELTVYRTLKDDEISSSVDANTRAGALQSALMSYIHSGVVAEQAEHLLTTHILTNPRVMRTISEFEIREAEKKARDANIRASRLAALRQAQIATGRRSVPGYTPDDIDPIDMLPILDRHGDGMSTNAPIRDVQEIADILNDHKALGFSAQPSIDPVSGESIPAPLEEDQVEALALIDYAHLVHSRNGNVSQASQEYGIEQSNVNTKYGHPDLDSLGIEQTAGFGWTDWTIWPLLQASGFNGEPLLLDAQEFSNLSRTEDAQGRRQSIVITRGLTGTSISIMQSRDGGFFANMLLRLKRAILGGGGQTYGPGEYWSSSPASWPSNNEAAVLGILTRGVTRLGSHEILIGTSSTSSGNGSDVGVLTSFFYEAMWSVVNALGGRGFKAGVNKNHGKDYQSDIPVNMVKLDRTTGLYDQAGLDELSRVIQMLTQPSTGAPGSGGIMTLENWAERNTFFVDQILPDVLPNSRLASNAERNDSVIKERMFINAWLGQHLSWLVQLAQMRRDESDPVNGAANKQWNRRLEAAAHSLVFLDPNGRAALMGYDALIRHETSYAISNPDRVSEAGRFGEYDFWEDDNSRLPMNGAKVVLVMNRTAVPMLRRPIIGQTVGDRQDVNSPGWVSNIGLTWDDIFEDLPGTIQQLGNLTPSKRKFIKYLAKWGIRLS